MKIRNEQLQALQKADDQRAKTQKADGGFTELLSRELNADPQGAIQSESAPLVTDTVSSTLNLMQSPALRSLQESLVSATKDLPLEAGALTAAAGQMEDMLSSLESYAAQLARDDKADLREAFDVLNGINDKISDFKTRFTDLEARHSGLAELFNELDILTTAETFKFNRGDYL